MHENIPILTIDGPSGSGKGTIARLIADNFGWHMLDSGALYRLLALHAVNTQCALDDAQTLAQLAQSLPVEFKFDKVYLAGVDVTKAIRAETCGSTASKISSIPEVRTALMARQHQFAQAPGLVADGRDMGTIVFPNAFLKIYLDASAAERAKRRFLQLQATGYQGSIQDLATEIAQRDERDKSRAVAPLKPADDAIIIDTSGMSVAEVCNIVMNEAQLRLPQL